MKNWLERYIGLFTFHFGGGGGGDTTTVQQADPWIGAQPYIKDLLKKGQGTTNNPYQFYNGDTIAGFSPEQELGFGLASQRAIAGSPTLNAANQNITDTLNGNYLSPDSNPYLRGTVDQALGDVQTRVNSQFNNNNFGGSAHQEQLTRDLGNQANSLYGQNYSMERNNQLQAATQAKDLAGADYQDSLMLQGIGAQRQGLSQQYLTDAKNQFDQAANFPYQQLDRYGNIVNLGLGAGGQTTSSQSGGDTGSSDVGTAAGLGLLAYAAFSDERLKTNIVKVGQLSNGINVYEYDKFGQRERGVMAQEVEKVLPNAVITHDSGYKMVNYKMLGEF